MDLSEKLVKVAENRERIYEKGKQAEHEEYINRFNANGARTNFENAFCSQDWSGYEFQDGEVVPATNVARMFYNYQGTVLPKGIRCEFDKSIIPLVTYRVNQIYTYATNLVEIYDTNLPVVENLMSMFAYCRNLKKIELLRLAESTIIGNAFTECYRLEEITIEGVIGDNFDIQYSPLTRASIESIVSALSDTVTGKTVHFKASAKTNAFTDEEWSELIATKPNWTFTLV